MKKICLLLMIIFLLTGCKKKTYTVTFYNDDGSKLSSVIVNEGDNIKSYEVPSKDGYIFVSWVKDGVKYDSNNEINDDIELTASYVLIPDVTESYTVTFKFFDEEKSISVKENELVSEPSTQNINKYKFLGWYKDDSLYDFNTPVTSDFTLVAKYEKYRVTVKFELDGGSGTVETEINKGSTLNISNPEKYGFNFLYWELDGNRFDTNTIINDDITLVARWEAKVYVRVKFDTDGGSVVLAKIIESGNKLTNVGIPEKDGYTFKYWTLNGEYFDIDSNITDNITLKAYYEVNEDLQKE